MIQDDQTATSVDPGVGDEEQAAALWAEAAKEEAGLEETPPASDAEGARDGGPGEEAPAEEPTASQENPDELWKDAPAALREAYERERQAREQAEITVKRHSGRLSQAHRDLEAARAELSKQTGGATEGKKALSDEEKAALREEYPDSVGKVLDIVDGLEEQVKTLSETASAQAVGREEAIAVEQYRTLEEQHKDWGQVVRSQEFRDWAERQPGMTIRTLQENAEQIIDGASCAKIISDFKLETARQNPEAERQQQRREEQRDALQAVGGRRPSAGSAKGSSDDPEALWKEAAAEERRRAFGR